MSFQGERGPSGNTPAPGTGVPSKYEIIRPLASGGMADIFVAQVRGVGGFQKIVVLKRVRADLAANQAVVRHFLDEARLAAALLHPNVVQVYDFGAADDGYYLVMEPVHGRDLRTIFEASAAKGRPISIDETVTIMLGVCAGLHYAHDAVGPDDKPLGIIHRDVSPSNVLVTFDGMVKVADFGIAKATTTTAETRPGTWKGKFGYMSPEQCLFQPLDRRSDIFAIGIILYELMTGKLLFPGDSGYEIMKLIVETPQPAPSASRPGFPAEMERIILKALARAREDRHQTVADLQLDLEAFAREHRLAISSRTVSRLMEDLFGKVAPNWLEGQAPSSEANEQTLAPDAGPPAGTPVGSLRTPGELRAEASIPTRPSFSSIERASARRSSWVRIGLPVGVVLAVVAAVAGYLRFQPGAPPPPAAVPALPDTADKASASLKTYLDEIERLDKAHSYRQALGLLAKANQLDVEDAELNIRLARTSADVQRNALLWKAEQQLAGGDPKAAIESAKEALDFDPESEPARALLTQAGAALAASALPDQPASAKPRREGTLTVLSDPQGLVFVDDLPVGRTPLRGHRLKEGKHEVQVRAEGRTPQTRVVTVGAGKEAQVSVKLEESGRRILLASAFETATDARPGPAPGEAPLSPAPAPDGGRAPDPAPGTPAKAAQQQPPVADAPPPQPAAAPPAPAAAIPAPRLPKTYDATTIKDIARVFSVIEKEVSDRGRVPADLSRGVSAALAQKLAEKFSPGQTVQLYPRATYYLICREAAAGKQKSAIGEELRRAHLDGRLQSAASP